MYIYKTIFCDLITEKLVSLLHIRHVDKPISTELKKNKSNFLSHNSGFSSQN